MENRSMNHEQAVKSQAAERYVLGELAQADREDFEAHYFDCQQCFEDVRQTSEFLRHSAAVLPTISEKNRFVQIFADLLRPAPALVTALFLCVIAGGAYQQIVIADLKAPRAESRYFLAGQTRAEGGEKPVVVRRDAQLSVSVEFTPGSEFKAYQAVVLNDSGKPKYLIPLHPQENDDSVPIVLRPDSLKEGKYSVAIQAQRRDGGWQDVGGGSFYLQIAN